MAKKTEQQQDELVGNEGGVAITRTKEGYAVQFEFDRGLIKMMRGIQGAEFVNDAWQVPVAMKDALSKLAPAMRKELTAISADREGIMELATKTAAARMVEFGAPKSAAPRVSDYRPLGDSVSGEIINVNGRFAAQLSGFGKEDKAAFVTVHRLADLDNAMLFKGMDVRIAYDKKGQGTVTDRSQERKRDETLGVKVDGVQVDEIGDKLHVAFDFNPSLRARLDRVSGVEFNKEKGVCTAPIENKEFVMRAVHDMRGIYVAEVAEKAALKTLASEKVDGAKVHDPFSKDGHQHFGTVIGQGEHFGLIAGGQGHFNLVRKDQLGGDPLVNGNKVEISYAKGRGAVVDKTLHQAKGKEAALSR